MKRIRPAFRWVVVLTSSFALSGPVLGRPQTPSTDYSTEPVVVEHTTGKVVFEADGTQTVDDELRIRVQSAAGLQAVGTVVLPYSRELTTLDVKYVRSKKPDGTVVETPVTAAIDLPADVTRAAPTFTDVYLKEINVKGLAVGDTLEYAFRMRSKSLIPGQFSLEKDWVEDAIVLAEDFEVSFPAAIDVKVKTFGDPQPSVESGQGMRTYRWHHANLKHPSDKEAAVQGYERRRRRADLQVTSFHSWADLGAAVRELWRDREAVTPAIRDKANELTRGLSSDDEKLAAIYGFVSTKIRYVAVGFGIGRIQPHAASEVLENGFGDCKDKHTLLAALLAAVGITAEPALIGPGQPFDQDVPSLGQFNHVITSVSNGTKQTWLDTTIEVAPLGLIVRTERDHDVLLLPATGAASVIKTPAAPSRPNSWRLDTVGTLSDTGVLDADVHEVLTGDLEVVLRTAFRLTPQAQWPQAMKELPMASRFSGAISNLEISPVEDTTTPLQLSYHFKVDNYSDWANRKIVAPVPFLNYSPAPRADAPNVPLELGGPTEFVLTSRLTLPSGYGTSLTDDSPARAELDTPFVRYRLQNMVNGRTFETRRELLWKENELLPAEFEAYRKFVDDFAATEYSVKLRSLRWEWNDTWNIDWYGGESAANRKALADAWAEFQSGKRQEAEATVREIARANPSSDKAWIMLASIQYNGDKHDEAIATLRKRIAEAPAPDAYKLLAAWLPVGARLDVCREGWQKFGKVDGEFALYFGEYLLVAAQYHEAATVLATQAQEQTKSSRFQWDLGRALLGDSQRDAGVAALRLTAELDSSPLVLNNVAYELADRSLALDDALSLAIRAVKGIEEATTHLTVDKVDVAALGTIVSLGAYWDTLAWAHFRLGHLDEAERYALAALELMGEEIYATHLSEIYKAKNQPEAATFYADSAAIMRTRDGQAMKALMEKDGNKTWARRMRDASMLNVPRQPNATGTAQAYVLTGPDGTITGVSFIQGDAALRPQAEALRGLRLSRDIPAGSTVNFLLRGSLQCRPDASECLFTPFQARGAAAMVR